LICWRYYLTREGRSADAQDYPIRCAGLWIGYARQVAFAGEKTVTLAVKNMYCADGPFIVKKSLEGVPGVAKAVVSLKDKTAIVTFDDQSRCKRTHERDYKSRLPINARELMLK
jgi:copper chaperone CopZ